MKKTIVSALLFCLLSLTACSNIFMTGNVEELLVAPQPNSLQTAAFNAIKAFAGEQAVIVSPKNGAHSGALLFDDGTFTGEQSIISFYSDSNSGTDINVAILREQQGVLTVTHSLRGVGYGVESVEFNNLRADESMSLLVSYAGVTADEMYLTVYSFENDNLSSVFVQDYSSLLVSDIQGGEENELVFALPTTREGSLNLRIISLSTDTPIQLYQGTPNPEIMEAVTIKSSFYGDETLIVLEGLDVQNRLSGDLLKFEEGEVFSLLSSEERQLITHDNRLLFSLDIDGDGIVEQPGMLPTETQLPTDYLSVGYYDMGTDADLPKYVGIVNSRLAFFVNLPAHWIGHIEFLESPDGITVVNSDKNELYFSLILSDFAEPPISEDGTITPLLQLGNEQLYIMTYGNMTDYELRFVTQGIKALY